MGDVFRSICQSNHRPNQMEHISGRIVIALLAESKDKLSLPYAAFAQTVFQNKDENSLAWGLFGRIGVSLMLRYHKTHQWAKVNEPVTMHRRCEESWSCRHIQKKLWQHWRRRNGKEDSLPCAFAFVCRVAKSWRFSSPQRSTTQNSKACSGMKTGHRAAPCSPWPRSCGSSAAASKER